MRFGILGTLLVVGDSGEDIRVSAGRQRAVLATLMVHANRPVSPDVFAELAWEGAPPVNYTTTLRNYVMRLRRTLGGAAAARIETREPGYVLRAEESELDLLRFEALCREASAALRDEAWSKASDAAAEALALWRDTPLLDVPSQPLRDDLVPRVERLRVQVLEDRAEAGLRLGRHEQLVADLREAVAAHPLRERLHTQLILALYRSRRQAEALAAYRDARKVLVEELGTEPGPELRRVHGQILAGDADPTNPPSTPVTQGQAAPVPRQLPSAARHFTGRRDELELIDSLVDSSQDTDAPGGAVVISAIDGTAGIGKTALAIHAAHRLAGKFPDGQLHIDLRGFDPSGVPVPTATAVRRFLDAFAVPPARIPQDLHAQIDLYRSVLADKRVLLVLDNARDTEQVRPLLPGAAGCLVLITSRNRLAGLVALEGAVPVTLDLLTRDEARDLLTRRLGAGRIAREERAVGELIELCARLPLALNLAAAQAALHPRRELDALNQELRDGRRRLDALALDEGMADVRAVFSWSYTALGPNAARMFRLLGLHPGPDISLPAAASIAAVDRDRAQKLLAELTAAHLVTQHPPGRYVLHDLLRAYAAEQSQAHDTQDERHQALHRALSHYLHTAVAADRLIDPSRDPIAIAPGQPGVVPETPDDVSQAWQWYETEHATLHAAVARAAEEAEELGVYAWQIPWALANLSFRRGHWHEQIEAQQTAVRAAERLGDLNASALAHRFLGRIHTRMGAYPQAHASLRRALTLFEQTGDHVGQAHTYRAMAWVLEREGHLTEALDCAQRALKLFRAVDHRFGQASSLNAAGWLHSRLGDHQQALIACTEALELHREIGDLDGEATTLESLGRAHHHLGRHREAIAYYEQALPLLRETGARYFEADTLTHLGDTHQAGGDTNAARAAWQQALTILDDLHHPDAEAVRTKLLGS